MGRFRDAGLREASVTACIVSRTVRGGSKLNRCTCVLTGQLLCREENNLNYFAYLAKRTSRIARKGGTYNSNNNNNKPDKQLITIWLFLEIIGLG